MTTSEFVCALLAADPTGMQNVSVEGAPVRGVVALGGHVGIDVDRSAVPSWPIPPVAPEPPAGPIEGWPLIIRI